MFGQFGANSQWWHGGHQVIEGNKEMPKQLTAAAAEMHRAS